VGCGACGEVCPAGAIQIKDMISEETGKMVRYIERNWGQCIFCSQCYVYCITKKGIYLDPDFEKSTLERGDFINSHEKELLLCERCSAVITAVDHVRWINDKLGELAFANPTLMIQKYSDLKLVEEGTGENPRDTLERDKFMKILCPNCRASFILSDQWGES
jgi:hydrogenase-4 component H